MKDRGLKQIEAADLFGVRQPNLSKMLRGEFRQFSVKRLLRFLVALDQWRSSSSRAAEKTKLRLCISPEILKEV